VRSLAAIQSLIDKVGNLKHNNNSGIFIFFIAFAMTLLMAHYYHKYIEIGLSYKIRALALRNKKRENVFQN
jgi:peptidoglycan/LPS O-acetylase OafA/YrhL